MSWIGDGVAGDVPAWFVRTLAFVFGALWGSFFNVAIYRWPRGMSVVKPPSHCPACGAPVAAYLNIPIVGYLLLRGRARCCGAKMTPRYAWVELLTAVLGLAVAERFFVNAPDTPLGAAAIESGLYFVFVGALVIGTFVDLEWMEIPDEVSLPGAALGLATVGFRAYPGPVGAAVGAGLGFLITHIPFVWGYELLRGHRGMGEGDPKFLLMIGAFLGWEGVLFCIFAGSVQGLVVAGIAMATGSSMVPTRPDEAPTEAPPGEASPGQAADVASSPVEDGSEPADAPTPPGHLAGTPPAGSETGAAPDEEAGSPPRIVFGPMLAVSALEYLFFGDQVREAFFQLFGP